MLRPQGDYIKVPRNKRGVGSTSPLHTHKGYFNSYSMKSAMQSALIDISGEKLFWGVKKMTLNVRMYIKICWTKVLNSQLPILHKCLTFC